LIFSTVPFFVTTFYSA